MEIGTGYKTNGRISRLFQGSGKLRQHKLGSVKMTMFPIFACDGYIPVHRPVAVLKTFIATYSNFYDTVYLLRKNTQKKTTVNKFPPCLEKDLWEYFWELK